MTLGKLHLLVGLLAITAFVLSGVYLRLHSPPLAEMDGTMRLFLRSRHLYLMCGGAVNVCLGLYVTPHSTNWRKWLQWIGSALILLAPIFLAVAFGYEPSHFSWQPFFSRWGLIALFSGTFAHFLSLIGKPFKDSGK